MMLQCLPKRSDAVDHVRISLGTQKYIVLLAGLGFLVQG